MKNTVLSLFILLCNTILVFSVHNMGGEIIYKQISKFTYEVTVITYTKASINASRDSIEINWGDGNYEMIARTNGFVGAGGIPQGEMIHNDIKKNEYTARHTYPTANTFFVVSMTDPNRNGGILNINNGNSVNILFYMEDTIRIFDPVEQGYNSSPVPMNNFVYITGINDTFSYNPAFYDPDGDRLSYELVEPKANVLMPVPQYQFPDEVNPAPDNHFSIDPNTGHITWAVPQAPLGTYVFTILAKEYRDGVLLGTVMKDIQVILVDENNSPPFVSQLRDTCVLPGHFFQKGISASDPDSALDITLSVYKDSLQSLAPYDSIFVSPPAPNVNGYYEWQTTCDHIRKAPYQYVLRAQDDFRNQNNLPLPHTFDRTWTLKVIAPQPQDLQSSKIDTSTILKWSPVYPCDANATDQFIGYSVWRKIDSSNFQIDSCTQGVQGNDYLKVAEQISGNQFVDSVFVNGTFTYCYRVVAEFASESPSGKYYNIARSIPSNETCVEQSYFSEDQTNISESGKQDVVRVFPNPSDSYFVVNADLKNSGRVNISLYNLNGKMLHSKELNTLDGVINERIEVKNLSNGCYFLRLQSSSDSFVKKVVVGR